MNEVSAGERAPSSNAPDTVKASAEDVYAAGMQPPEAKLDQGVPEASPAAALADVSAAASRPAEPEPTVSSLQDSGQDIVPLDTAATLVSQPERGSPSKPVSPPREEQRDPQEALAPTDPPAMEQDPSHTDATRKEQSEEPGQMATSTLDQSDTEKATPSEAAPTVPASDAVDASAASVEAAQTQADPSELQAHGDSAVAVSAAVPDIEPTPAADDSINEKTRSSAQQSSENAAPEPTKASTAPAIEDKVEEAQATENSAAAPTSTIEDAPVASAAPFSSATTFEALPEKEKIGSTESAQPITVSSSVADTKTSQSQPSFTSTGPPNTQSNSTHESLANGAVATEAEAAPPSGTTAQVASVAADSAPAAPQEARTLPPGAVTRPAHVEEGASSPKASGVKPEQAQREPTSTKPTPGPAHAHTKLPESRRSAPRATVPPKDTSPRASNGPIRSRQEELSRIQRENDEMRLMWLSLPSNDHPTYYSDTDDEASSSTSSAADAILPRGARGQVSYLSKGEAGSTVRKCRKDDWCQEDEDEEEDSADEDDARLVKEEERMYRSGNRGKKLRKSSRWIRRGKLGSCSEARSEKDIHERFTDRVKALQRQNVNSLLQNSDGPPMPKQSRDMLEGSDRMLLRDINDPPQIEENSMLLAPQLLRPIMSARALLQSHTLRHTFRNPHLVALSRTALDLRESESCLSRSLARCFGAIEHASLPINGTENGDVDHSHRVSKRADIDPQAIGVEGTHGTEDELNPAFAQLDRLFVTKEGLPIPIGGPPSEDEQMQDADAQGASGDETAHAILPAAQQRDVVRAALECLHELGADSLEYVERLDEVRTRLSAVKQKRTEVWNALRLWALKRDGDSLEGLVDLSGGAIANGAAAHDTVRTGSAADTAAIAAAAGVAAASRSNKSSGGPSAGNNASNGSNAKPSAGSSGRSAKRQRERA